jgi:ribosome-associated protein
MDDLYIKNGTTIPAHELIITASRAGGPGGQHVNKTSTKITVRWNLAKTNCLTPEEKERVMAKLKSQITEDGDILVHNGSSRSQMHNKKMALNDLAQKINKALHVQKKRVKTKISQGAKETRLQNKRKHSEVKKMRRKVEE